MGHHESREDASLCADCRRRIDPRTTRSTVLGGKEQEVHLPGNGLFEAVYYSQPAPRSRKLSILGLAFDRIYFPGVSMPPGGVG